MEDSSVDFNAELQARIKDKHLFIIETVLPVLSDSISEHRVTLDMLVNALKNAGILTEDRFRSMSDPHELKIPPDDAVDHDARIEEISHRLSDYIRQLEFLEENYDLSPDSMAIERINELIHFFNFINWQRMSSSSDSYNERTLAWIEGTVSTGDDFIIKGIFRDSKKQLSESLKRIRNGLEDIKNYLIENYKLEIRNRVLPNLTLAEETTSRNLDEVMLMIKKEFRNEMRGIPFISEPVRELVNEEYSRESEELKKKTLQRIPDYKTRADFDLEDSDAEDEENNTDMLFEGFRLLAAACPALLQVADKLQRNSDIVEDAHQSLLKKLIYFLIGRKIKNPERIYPVVIFNAQDETAEKLRIDMLRFCSEMKKEINRLISIGDQSSRVRLKLEQASPSDIEAELEKHLKRMFRYLSVLPAIDLYLKNRASNAMRASMNGIKLDLNDLQSCVMKSNKRRLEYQARQKFGF